MSLPEVSVVIPVRNGSKYIEECIDRAWNEIKDRKGKMSNGTFKKD